MTIKTPIATTTEVQYDHAHHKYYLGDRIYRSATQILDQFVNPFDTAERSSYMADRYGETPAYWQRKWDGIRDTALVRGTAIHAQQEQFLYDKGTSYIAGMAFRVFPNQFGHFLATRIEDGNTGCSIPIPDGIYPEMKIWDHNWGIAGRMDKPTIHTIRKRRFLHIEDYKTGRKISRESYQDPITKQYRMMKEPLAHLMDCEWTHFMLQLSLYQYMGEYHDFLPGKLRIIHYPHEIEGLGTPKPMEYDVPYLRDDVLRMLRYLKYIGWLN